MVHPASSWSRSKSTAVKQYSRFEVSDVAITARSPLNRHDLTVDSFCHRIGDPVRTTIHSKAKQFCLITLIELTTSA
jgi:hypothetical protein